VSRPAIYRIEGGEVFEGTLEQFKDCFFSNADDESIKAWAEEHRWTYEKVEHNTVYEAPG
jgi:hypothetical protein